MGFQHSGLLTFVEDVNDGRQRLSAELYVSEIQMPDAVFLALCSPFVRLHKARNTKRND